MAKENISEIAKYLLSGRVFSKELLQTFLGDLGYEAEIQWEDELPILVTKFPMEASAQQKNKWVSKATNHFKKKLFKDDFNEPAVRLDKYKPVSEKVRYTKHQSNLIHRSAKLTNERLKLASASALNLFISSLQKEKRMSPADAKYALQEKHKQGKRIFIIKALIKEWHNKTLSYERIQKLIQSEVNFNR